MYRGSEYMIGGVLSGLADGGTLVLVASKTIGRTRDAGVNPLDRYGLQDGP